MRVPEGSFFGFNSKCGQKVVCRRKERKKERNKGKIGSFFCAFALVGIGQKSGECSSFLLYLCLLLGFFSCWNSFVWRFVVSVHP